MQKRYSNEELTKKIDTLFMVINGILKKIKNLERRAGLNQ